MDILAKAVTIDWQWVEDHVSRGEKFDSAKDVSVKKALLEHAKKAFELARLKAKPKALIVKKKILKFNPGSVEIEGNILLSGKELSSYFKGASEVYVFLATVGDAIEKAASIHMDNGDPLLGYLLDRTGSFAVESLAERIENNIRQAIKSQGLGLSMRLSPGYCDWPVEEQLKLAEMIDFKKAGISLNEHCMMIPKKSISAIAGAGRKELFLSKKSQCSVCNLKKCDYRRIV